MKIKKTLVITLFLLCILMIGAVNASSTDDTVASSDVNDNTVSSSAVSDNKVTATAHNTDKVKKTINNSTKIKKTNNKDNSKPLAVDEYNPKSFKALDNTINEATEHSKIELDMDYLYDDYSDSDFKYGINITKSLTIKGNNITIDADHQARIFNINKGVELKIMNVKFINGYVDSSQDDDPECGGAAIFNNGKLTLENVEFHNNTAIKVPDNINGNGAAIYTNGNSQTDIINCIFTQNNATSNGGAIFANNTSKITINNSKFIENTAKDSGGAIYTNNSAKISIINTEFNNNSAHSAGSICIADYSQATIEDSNFTKNTADTAGALYNNAIATLTNTQFDNNTATRDGGAIVNYGELTITNNTFSNNKATGKYGDGGAINVGSHATTTITDSILNNNIANNNGGAIYNAMSDLTITNTQFNNNSVNKYGGAIYTWNNTNLDISNSNFTNNKDVNITAIYIVNGTNDTINIYDSIFLDNNVTCEHGNVNLSKCTITIRKLTNFIIENIGNSTIDKPILFNVNEVNGFTGTVTVKIGTQNYTVQLTNGKGTKEILINKVGTYKAIINYSGNTTYKEATAESNSFTIKYPTEFTIKIGNSTIDKPITIEVTEANGFTGTVIVKIGTQNYTVQLKNGKGTNNNTIINKVGTYQATLEFPETETYTQTTTKSNTFYIKYPTEFKISNIPDIPQGFSIDLVVTEKNKYTGDVVVTIGTKKYTVTLKDGSGQKTVTPDLAPGIYNAKIKFKGNTEYLNATAQSNNFLVYKFVVKVTNSTIDKPVTIKVTEVNGFTGTVTVKIGTQKYNVELTNGKGTTEKIINKVGTYQATVEFAGKETTTKSNTFYIKYPTKFIIGKISDFIKGSSIKLNINEQNNYTGNVVVTIGTKKYTVTLKDGSGQKTVTPDLAPGIYNAKINFKGNTKYWNATAKSNKFTIKYPLNPKNIAINISSKILTQVFNVNDVNYVCYIKDKKMNYFDGNIIVTFYDTASSDVTLKKKYTPLVYTWRFKESDKISGFWLLNNNKLVLRKTVTSSSELKNLNIINSTSNSALYKKLFKGEDKGKSVLCVFKGLDFSNGFDKVTKIRVTYSRNGEPKNLTKIKSVKFIHDIPKPVTLTLKKVNVKKSSKKLVLSATLKKGNKAIRNKSVTFNFNGKKYVRSTDKKGVAKVTITKQVLEKLKVGKKIKYQVSYNGKTTKRTAIVKE